MAETRRARFICPTETCGVETVEAVGLAHPQELDCLTCPACHAPMVTEAPSPASREPRGIIRQPGPTRPARLAREEERR